MKHLWAAALATSMASSAFAGSISFDGRFDYNTKSYNEDAGKPSHSTFTAKIMRLDFQNKLNEDISFRARFRLDQQDATKNKKDTLSKAVDLAFISHKTSDLLTMHFGKFSSEMGGFEGSVASADLYMTSEAYSGKDAVGGALVPGVTDYLYLTGVKAAFKMDSYTVSLLVTDRNNSMDLGGTKGDEHETQNTRFLTGVVAKGSHMEGALKTNLSHVMEDETGDVKRTWSALGVQYTFSDYVLSLDYLMNEQKDPTASDKVTSIVSSLTYKGMGAWTPSLKVFSSDTKIESGAGDDKGMGTSLVVEYKPSEEANFRYHFAANMVSTKGDSTADKTKSMTEALVGFRLNADFLK